jgi:septum formation protein
MNITTQETQLMDRGDGEGRARRVALASRSPRRLDILRKFGFQVEVVSSDFDESALSRSMAPRQFAAAAARGKALHASSPEPIVGADTIVVADGAILGKPADDADARRMLALLGGRSHEVITAVALLHNGELSETIDFSEVTFAPLSAEQIVAYVEGGEPRDKAGAYAIQGEAGRYIIGYSGSYWNIVGFPIEAFLDLWKLRFGSKLRADSP